MPLGDLGFNGPVKTKIPRKRRIKTDIDFPIETQEDAKKSLQEQTRKVISVEKKLTNFTHRKYKSIAEQY